MTKKIVFNAALRNDVTVLECLCFTLGLGKGINNLGRLKLIQLNLYMKIL